MDIKLSHSLSPIQKKEVEDLLIDSKGLVFQESDFNNIVSAVFGTKKIFILVYNKRKLVAFCIGHIKKKRFLKTIELKPLKDVPYGGFIYNKNNCNLIDLLRIIPQKLFTKYIYHSGPVLDINSKSHFNNDFVSMETSLLDLSGDEDDLWNNGVNSKRRNMIRKALKAGINVDIFDNEQGLKQFWPMLDSLHKKLHFKDLTYKYYNDILNTYMPNGNARVLLAKKEGKYISGTIIIGNKEIMHYWKGASQNEIKNEGQGDLLQWEAIKYAKQFGSKYYDLCVIDKKNLAQIAKFKLGFSNITVPFYSITKTNLSFKIINHLLK